MLLCLHDVLSYLPASPLIVGASLFEDWLRRNPIRADVQGSRRKEAKRAAGCASQGGCLLAPRALPYLVHAHGMEFDEGVRRERSPFPFF